MSGGRRISIVIPTWNRLALVRQAIDSVLAQTHEDWQLIVVDDGSTDGTVEAVRKLTDPRLKVLSASHSGSTAITRNRAIEAATGDWIAFLDSDDLWEPRKLEVQLQALAAAGAGWCYSDYRIVDQAAHPLAHRISGFQPLSGRIIEPLLLGRTAAFIGTVVVRSDLLASIGGFDPSLRYREDLDLEFRLALAADAVAVPEVLVSVRSHGDRKTAMADFPFERSALVYRKFLDRSPERRLRKAARSMLARLMADAGGERMAEGDIVKGLQLAGQSLLMGCSPSHWLRANVRGLRGVFR